MGQLVGAQGQVKEAKKMQNTPTCDVPTSKRQTKKKKIFFRCQREDLLNCRGFEQLSSSSGWRFMAKKGRANLLARAVVKEWRYCALLRIRG